MAVSRMKKIHYFFFVLIAQAILFFCPAKIHAQANSLSKEDSALVENHQPSEPKDSVNIIYYKFYNGVQMVELDFWTPFCQHVEFVNSRWMMNSLPSFAPPHPNVYFFRDSTGHILKSYNVYELNVEKFHLENPKNLDMNTLISHPTNNNWNNLFSYPSEFSNPHKSGSYLFSEGGTIRNPHYSSWDSKPVYFQNAKYGLIDSLGNVIVKPKYDEITCFSTQSFKSQSSDGIHGTITVVNNEVNVVLLNKKYGVINTKGKEILPCQFDHISGLGRVLLIKQDSAYSFYSMTGNEISKIKYDYVDLSEYAMMDGMTHGMTEGMIKVGVKNKFGYVNANGKQITELKYDLVYPFENGRAIVGVNNKFGFIDTAGKEVIPLMYDRIENFGHDFNDSLVKVKLNYKWGCIDEKGKVVIAIAYDEMMPFYDGLSRVKYYGKYGYLNLNGKLVIPVIYDEAGMFSEGKSLVELNGEKFIIDKKGERVAK
jgi:hypothetical protein